MTWPAPLGPAARYGLAGEFVKRVEAHTEADPVGLLVQFLVATGSVFGRGAHYVVEATEHHTRLFAGLVGESAKSRKGTSWSHVYACLTRAAPLWAAMCVQTGLSTGEGLIYAVRDGDGDDDPGALDKRLMVVESELASTLRIMGRDGNTLSATVRRAWDTGDLRILTRNSPVKATGAHVSIIGHITRDELRRYLDRTEAGNGFGNRFLWVCVKRARTLPEGGAIHTVSFQDFDERLKKVMQFAQDKNALQLERDNEARALWRDVYPALSEGRPGLLGAVTSRAEAQVTRLSLVYALLDGSDTIRRAHLEAALEVWRYADQSATYIFGDALGDPVADTILSALRSRLKDGMSREEIHALFGRHRRAGEITAALKVLVERKLVRVEQRSTGGRPAERWFAVQECEESEKSEERETATAEPGVG